MKFLWSWLSDFVDLSGLDPFAVADRFTLTVAELEKVERVGTGLEAIITARVERLERHPADARLKVVYLNIGREVLCVSGAPNLMEGAVVPVALVGPRLPSGVKVEARDLRGVVSEAIVLSEAELGLSDDHSGVLVLPADTPVGKPLPEAVPGVEDVVFEVDNKAITHRPDLWGHLGIAREIAAMMGRTLRKPSCLLEQGTGQPIRVIVDAAEDCPRYMAMAFCGVKIAPSPFPIARRLHLCGVRPINNVVDLTNYVMLALGEPTHAFDRRMIRGDTIWVRRAKDGEQFRTLDGREHVLSSEDLLIADAERGIALAGVMGGEESGIGEDTTEVVLEAATFNPRLVRKTSLRHGLRTESSARFEKGLDPRLPPFAVAMFANMLKSLCEGAYPAAAVSDFAQFRTELPQILLDPQMVSRRLGTEVPRERIVSILQSLEFGVASEADGLLRVEVPSHRATRDIALPEDLVEEVGRLYGYDKIPAVPPTVTEALVPQEPMRLLARQVRHLLAYACGLDEVMTYSFPSEALLQRLGLSDCPAIRLRNRLSQDHARLRTDLAQNLFLVLVRNANHAPYFGVFEVGRVFLPEPGRDGLPNQPHHVAVLLYDRNALTTESGNLLFRKVKGIVEFLLEKLAIKQFEVNRRPDSAPPWAHPNRVAAVNVCGRNAGLVAGVHARALRVLDCRGCAALAEIDLQVLLEAPRTPKTFRPVPKFPGVESDLSFLVPQRAPASEIVKVLQAHGGPYLASIRFIDEYFGQPIPSGFRSVTYRLTFQASDRTLTDEEVREAVDKIVAAARARGFSLRE